MITNPNPERRERIIYIPYGEVLNALLAKAISQNRIEVLQAVGLPPTAKAIAFWDAGARAAIAFRIEDVSFDPVPVGTHAPEMEITWQTITLDRVPDPFPEDPAQTKLSLGQ